MTNTTALLSAPAYAQTHGISVRTVRRYLADDKLPGARQLPNGDWLIPADAEPTRQATANPAAIDLAATYVTAPGQDIVTYLADPTAPPTLPEQLDALPVLVPLEDAARILGTTVGAIRRRREVFAAEPLGPRGRLVVPASAIRKLAGI